MSQKRQKKLHIPKIFIVERNVRNEPGWRTWRCTCHTCKAKTEIKKMIVRKKGSK